MMALPMVPADLDRDLGDAVALLAANKAEAAQAAGVTTEQLNESPPSVRTALLGKGGTLPSSEEVLKTQQELQDQTLNRRAVYRRCKSRFRTGL